MITKVPKRFQLDLSNPNRRKIEDNTPPQEPSAGVDLIVGGGVEEPNSFRARLNRRIAEDEALDSDINERKKNKKFFAPDFFRQD